MPNSWTAYERHKKRDALPTKAGHPDKIWSEDEADGVSREVERHGHNVQHLAQGGPAKDHRFAGVLSEADYAVERRFNPSRRTDYETGGSAYQALKSVSQRTLEDAWAIARRNSSDLIWLHGSRCGPTVAD